MFLQLYLQEIPAHKFSLILMSLYFWELNKKSYDLFSSGDLIRLELEFSLLSWNKIIALYLWKLFVSRSNFSVELSFFVFPSGSNLMGINSLTRRFTQRCGVYLMLNFALFNLWVWHKTFYCIMFFVLAFLCVLIEPLLTVN